MNIMNYMEENCGTLDLSGLPGAATTPTTPPPAERAERPAMPNWDKTTVASRAAFSRLQRALSSAAFRNEFDLAQHLFISACIADGLSDYAIGTTHWLADQEMKSAHQEAESINRAVCLALAIGHCADSIVTRKKEILWSEAGVILFRGGGYSHPKDCTDLIRQMCDKKTKAEIVALAEFFGIKKLTMLTGLGTGAEPGDATAPGEAMTREEEAEEAMRRR